jgi:hypothetical protein
MKKIAADRNYRMFKIAQFTTEEDLFETLKDEVAECLVGEDDDSGTHPLDCFPTAENKFAKAWALTPMSSMTLEDISRLYSDHLFGLGVDDGDTRGTSLEAAVKKALNDNIRELPKF